MRIAIIGWGSLIWDPRELPKVGDWQSDGPELPIEFSRISLDKRLTLVIDPINGNLVRTLHVLSPRASLDKAQEDLRKREGTTNEYIGWVNNVKGVSSLQAYPEQKNIHGIVVKWCKEHEYSAAVWTALPSNFKAKFSGDFSVEKAMAYLAELPITKLEKALEYIRRAPANVDTATRREAEIRYGRNM